MLRIATYAMLLLAAAAVAVMASIGAARLIWHPLPISIESRTWAPPSSGQTAVPAFTMPPITAYPETLARPVFFEGRKFPTPEPVKAKVEPATPPTPAPVEPAFNAAELKLHGIVAADGRFRALIDGPAIPLDWLTEGATVRGWTLTRIEPQRVTFSAGSTSIQLDLYPRAQ